MQLLNSCEDKDLKKFAIEKFAIEKFAIEKFASEKFCKIRKLRMGLNYIDGSEVYRYIWLSQFDLLVKFL